MGQTKRKLKNDQVALGAWIMIGHPTIAEIYAGEGFDWICVDMEHTATELHSLHEIALALRGTECDLFVRMPECDAALAKRYLDTGADGLIVPLVNSAEQARKAVSIARFPPDGQRGAAFSRASDFGRNFHGYYASHNEKVVVAVMLEHIEAVKNVDEILNVPGIDATFIGPYDLSASMGLAGQLDHPDVIRAQQTLLDACKRHNIPAGFHVVPDSPELLKQRVNEGYRFIACSLDTELLIRGCQRMLKGVRQDG